MDLFDSTHHLLEGAMRGAAARQAALATNLANANTPGYRRVDVDFHSVLQHAAAGSKADADAVATETTFAPEVDRAARMRLDGGTVDLDVEAAELAANGLEYQALVTAARARIGIIQSAIGGALMGLFDALTISASGLSAERLRMDVTAENLANAQSTQGPDGQPYRRKEVVLQATGGPTFQTVLDGALGRGPGRPAAGTGVQVAAIVEDPNPGRRIYDPGHPDADEAGYVTLPNVDAVTEMVDLIGASRAYEANVTAMQTAKAMFTKTLELLR